jgi:hypothetical protein
MSFTRSGVNVSHQADFAKVELLEASFNKTPASIRIIVRELLLHLSEAQAIRNQLIGINADLIFAGGTTKAGNVNDIGNSLEILLDHPVFDRFQLHHVVLRIRAAEREEVDLPDWTPVSSHLRYYTNWQGHLRESFENTLPVPGILFHIIEN